LDQETDPGISASNQVSRQPTIEEPPPSPTFQELFHSNDVSFTDVINYLFWLLS
jgi:hypothetical protein